MMTDEEYLKSLGFACLDCRPGIYEKTIVCCNSVCIGCEYHIGITVYANYADSYYKMNCYLYKPPAVDEWHGGDGEQGGIILPVVDTERKRLEEVIADAVIAVCRIMSALDMRQISGQDLIDLGDCPRDRIMARCSDAVVKRSWLRT